jgi:hypothetical protein
MELSVLQQLAVLRAQDDFFPNAANFDGFSTISSICRISIVVSFHPFPVKIEPLGWH